MIDIKQRNKKRNNYIKVLKKQNFSLSEIGRVVGLTAERVRQILTNKYKWCSIHQRNYLGSCIYCQTEKRYKYLLKRFSKDGILDDIKKLSIQNRHKDLVIQRRLLVKLLKDKYRLPLYRIAKLLNRHHTSIINLYYDKRTK